MKCPGGWIPVRYPPIKTKNGRRLPGDICAAFHPHLEARMGPSAFQALLVHLAQMGPAKTTEPPLEPMGPVAATA